ncbi:hypothetical protein [Roseinatronobacter sp.]|uniref:hypothetical protein n=1 Tax=Roseinatronobacter sp. TaxID=1945755 RepID=UPI003F6F5566
MQAGIAHRRLPDLKALNVSRRGSLRHGVLIKLTGPRPLTILNTVLKSGCFESTGRQGCGDLFVQLPVLRDWYDAQHRPVITGGDLNRRLKLQMMPSALFSTNITICTSPEPASGPTACPSIGNS